MGGLDIRVWVCFPSLEDFLSGVIGVLFVRLREKHSMKKILLLVFWLVWFGLF